jgi:hypothetical protein
MSIIMSISEALVHQGYDANYIHEVIDLMRERIVIGHEWPDDVMLEHGLEPNYIFELLNVNVYATA